MKAAMAGLLAFSVVAVAPTVVQRAAEARSPLRLTENGETLKYGQDPLQSLDFYPAQAAEAPAPLVLFVHGGGWTRGSKDNATGQYKADHYTAAGYNFATIDYRLVPEATVEQQAQDVADALAHLLTRAPGLHLDPNRVVLMGHSAGAHLVSLVGTDPQYLENAGLSPDDISGIIPLDGAAYDVARQMEANRVPLLAKRYDDAFGTDPARQRALSPTLQSAAPNVGQWLILHVDREDGRQQSESLAAALNRGGSRAQVQAIDGRGLRGHAQINRQLGDPDYTATPIVDAWLARIFG